ncbi:hypothetical protein [Paraburkholderia diazotrophica]|uniref:hypothetical protein n=1 Tax=Paraburkholderia diazotrophica TaxID=667676 RepID=UPI000B89B6B0|nr:hypothetical protein [Paraburkholderia diazotrophica]
MAQGKSRNNIQAAADNPHSGYEIIIAAAILVMHHQVCFELRLLMQNHPISAEIYQANTIWTDGLLVCGAEQAFMQ